METLERTGVSDIDCKTLDELLFELGRRVQKGEPVDLAEYKGRFPEAAEKFDKAFQALLALAQWTDDDPDMPGMDHTADGPCMVGGTKVLGDYRLLEEIGRGGMGVVYKAEQISLGRTVALKVLPLAGMLDERQLNRFKNEARAAATLDHPHIVAVYAIGHERAVHFYAMRYVEGQSIAELIEELKRLNLQQGLADSGAAQLPRDDLHAITDIHEKSIRAIETVCGRIEQPTPTDEPRVESDDAVDSVSPSAGDPLADTRRGDKQTGISTVRSTRAPVFFRGVARLGIQAAGALEHAHSNGVLHRDIKPANLMLDSNGDLLVADFGLARLEADAGMTMTGDIVGTLRYMAPEQALANHGVVDHRADIYSLGATLYELATLRPVYSGRDREQLLNQITYEEPTSPRRINPSIPWELETIVLKAMAKNPEERYDTAQELADDLRAFLDDRPIKARRATMLQLAGKWSRRHVGVVWTAMAAAILLALGLAMGTGLLAESRNEAIQHHTAAEEAARLAEEQRLLALRQRDLTLQNHYVASMKLAHQDWAEGNLTRMSDTLQQFAPQDNLPDLRGWEWYYLASLLERSENGFDPGLGAVRQVGWSADGRLLAAAGENGVKIIEPASRQAVHSMPQWMAFAWSSKGSYIAGVTRESPRRVVIWDRSLKKEIQSTSFGDTSLDPVAESTGFGALEWNPDGDVLAWTYGHTLHVWNIDEVESRKFVYRGERRLGFRALAWRPGGEALVVSDSAFLVDWNVAREDFVEERRLTTGQIPALASSPRHGKLAVATKVGRIPVWDPESSRITTLLDGHRGLVTSVTWSPDGSQVASAGEDNLIRIWNLANTRWNLATGRQINVLPGHTSIVTSIDWSPGGDQIVSGGKDDWIRIWNPQQRRDAMAISGWGNMAWAPTGTHLVTSCRVDSTDPADKNLREFTILDARTGRAVRTLDGRRRGGRVIAWSRDGRLIAAGDDKTVTSGGASVGVWDVMSGRQVHFIKGAHFSPNPAAADHFCGAIAWSPNGTRFASGGSDRLVKIWETSSGNLLHTLKAHNTVVSSILWSPDGRWLASGDWAHRIKIWYAQSWDPVWDLEPPGIQTFGAASHTIAWSPDSSRLAARFGHGRLVVWNIFDDRPPERVWAANAHTSHIRGLTWSPAGNRIATLSMDTLIKIWDADVGRELLTLDTHSHGASSVAWSPDGQRLASNDWEGTLLIWDASAAMRTRRESLGAQPETVSP